MANKPRSISDLLPFGKNIDTIQGQEVIVASVASGGERDFGKDGTKPLTLITLENGDVVHTFSDSLARDLLSIDPSNFPLTATFSKVKTRNGYEVWTVA